MSAVVIAQRSTAIEAEAPAADGQPRRTSAARFTADLLKPVANRIGARTPKAIAWELIKFYNAVDHGNGERATELAHSLYHQTITLVDQLANPSTDDHVPARRHRSTERRRGACRRAVAGFLAPSNTRFGHGSATIRGLFLSQAATPGDGRAAAWKGADDGHGRTDPAGQPAAGGACR